MRSREGGRGGRLMEEGRGVRDKTQDRSEHSSAHGSP